MTRSKLAGSQFALTVAALVVGVLVSGPDGTMGSDANPFLLWAAEAIKIGSASVLFLLVRACPEVARPLRLAGLAGAGLLLFAGVAGLVALTAASPRWGLVVTPLALAALILSGGWAAGLARRIGSVPLALVAVMLACAASAAFSLPPAGLAAALLGLVLWGWLAFALRRAA